MEIMVLVIVLLVVLGGATLSIRTNARRLADAPTPAQWAEIREVHDRALVHMLQAKPHQKPMARNYLSLACMRLRELGQSDLSSLEGLEGYREDPCSAALDTNLCRALRSTPELAHAFNETTGPQWRKQEQDNV